MNNPCLAKLDGIVNAHLPFDFFEKTWYFLNNLLTAFPSQCYNSFELPFFHLIFAILAGINYGTKYDTTEINKNVKSTHSYEDPTNFTDKFGPTFLSEEDIVEMSTCQDTYLVETLDSVLFLGFKRTYGEDVYEIGGRKDHQEGALEDWIIYQSYKNYSCS